MPVGRWAGRNFALLVERNFLGGAGQSFVASRGKPSPRPVERGVPFGDTRVVVLGCGRHTGTKCTPLPTIHLVSAEPFCIHSRRGRHHSLVSTRTTLRDTVCSAAFVPRPRCHGCGVGATRLLLVHVAFDAKPIYIPRQGAKFAYFASFYPLEGERATQEPPRHTYIRA